MNFLSAQANLGGSDLGWFGPWKMVKAFEDAVKRTGHGNISQVVQTQFGYHIIKKTGQKD